MSKSRRAKQRGLQRRTALSPKNIVEFALAESAKIQQRNRSMKTNVLQTAPALLGRVVCVAPPKEQSNNE